MKKILEKAKGKWLKDLLEILWSYKTTQISTTRESLFTLASGTEAVLSVEIGMSLTRISNNLLERNNEVLKVNLDLVEELRDQYCSLSVEDHQTL